MTNKEAAEIIKIARAEVEWEYPMDYAAAFDKAIEALKQEPCEDAISRRAVIDVIERWLECSGYNEAERHIMRAIQSVLYDSPSVKSQEPKTGHWIPVSERLPEKTGRYLITYSYRDEIETQEAVYVEGEEEDKWYDTTDIEITLAVIAWMPLPEPMKVGEENC